MMIFFFWRDIKAIRVPSPLPPHTALYLSLFEFLSSFAVLIKFSNTFSVNWFEQRPAMKSTLLELF